jgi:hypothetical protein
VQDELLGIPGMEHISPPGVQDNEDEGKEDTFLHCTAYCKNRYTEDKEELHSSSRNLPYWA